MPFFILFSGSYSGNTYEPWDFIQFRMKCSDQKMILPGRHDFSIHFCQRPGRSGARSDIGRADKRHGDLSGAGKIRLRVKAAQLAAVSVAHRRDIHRSKMYARVVLNAPGQQQ